MRVVVSVKSIVGKGASRLTRYIAEEEIIREREGNRRQLFSVKGNDLSGEDRTYREANRYLSRGSKTLRKRDLFHVVVSFREEDFEAIGANDTERKEALREVTREAMEQMRAGLGIADWRWIAGIHLNTGNPHLHIAIQKKVMNRETGRRKRDDFRNLGNFPKRMLPHSERGPDGVIRPVAGEIGEHFNAALDRAQTRARTADRAREEAAMIPPEIQEKLKLEQKPLSPEAIRSQQLRKDIAIAGELVRKGLAKQNDALWTDRMMETASRARSRGGRDLMMDIIERGPKPEPDGRFNPRDDIRAALRDRSLDDSEYRTQAEQAGELGRYSPALRALYEDGAKIMGDGDTLIIPAEEHQVPGERDHIRVIHISHAHEKIEDHPKLAAEFHYLARAIAGETADTRTEIEIFQHFHDQLERDAEGRPLDRRNEHYEQQWAESLNRVMGEMRSMARDMAQQETKVSIEVIPSMTEPSHVYRYIQDFERAVEFYSLAQKIVGPNADRQRETAVFELYYWKLERDDEGHKRAYGNEAGRLEAIDRTLKEMRETAEGKDILEPAEHAEIVHGIVSFNEVAGHGVAPSEKAAGAESGLEEEEERSLNETTADYDIDDDAPELNSLEEEFAIGDAYDEREADAAAWQFNTASRKVDLTTERLRFPEGLRDVTLEWLIERQLPEIDRRIDRGDPLHDVIDQSQRQAPGIVSDINRLVRPDRPELLNRVSKAAGFDREESLVRPANQHEIAEARRTLLALAVNEGRELESERALRARLAATEGREIQGGRGYLARRQVRVEKLIKGLEPQVHVQGGNRGEQPDISPEAQRMLLKLAVNEVRELESKGLLQARLAYEEGRVIREGRADLVKPQASVEELIEWLDRQASEPGRNRQEPPDISTADGRLFISLSNNPNALRLPVSNIRVYDQIDKMASGSRLQIYTRTSREGASLINGLTEQEYDHRVKIAGFLKGYVRERMGDPETRLIHIKEIFREARKALDGARTPEELNRLAYAFMSRIEQQGSLISEQERELLFIARPPAHYTPEMIELRQTWSLPREDRQRALREDKLPQSPAYKAIRGDLDRRRDVESVRQFQAALLNPPEEMANPSRLPLYSMHQRLLGHERDDIYLLAERAKRELPSRVRPAHLDSKSRAQAGSRVFGAVPYGSKSYQEYIVALGEIDRRLTDEGLSRRGDGHNPSREEQADIRLRARNLAWRQLVHAEVFDPQPSETAMRLSDTIARLQEEVQPRAALATKVLEEFGSKNIDGYKDGRVSKKALDKLESHVREKYRQLNDYGQKTREELYRGFETIDGLRAKIEKARAAAIMHDRKVLGEVAVAEARYECARFDHELARDFGHTFRFQIHDESTKGTRKLSVHDIGQRADARGVRAANETLAQRAEDRHQIRQTVSSTDLDHHSESVAEHRNIQMNLIDKREEEAGKAMDAYEAAREDAHSVIDKYRKHGKSSPAPFIDRQTLSKEQEEAIKRGLVGRTEALEKIRLAQSQEFNRPSRTDVEAARLRAQLFVARTDLRVREDRLEKYDRTRHLRKWGIPQNLRQRNVEDEKMSLADVDRKIEAALGRTTVFGNDGEIHIFGRKEAAIEAERWLAVREAVVGMISVQRGEISGKVEETKKLVDILSQAREHESEYRMRTGQAMPEPQFTRKELERVEDNAATLRSAALLKQFNTFERRFNNYADPKERISLDERLARVRGREVTAKVFLHESAKSQADFQATRQVQPLQVEIDGRLLTHRFLNTQPQSFIEKIIRDRIETPADIRLNEAVGQALQLQEQHIQAEVKKHQDYYEAAREITGTVAAERRTDRREPLPTPVFSSKEQVLIDRYINRLTERERDHFLAFINSDRDKDPARQDAYDRSNHRREEASYARESQSFNLGRAR
jgi:relaxase MobL-like protein